MIKLFPIIFLQIFLISPLESHPFYVTILQIDHNQDNNALELTFKVFTDDLEYAVEQDGLDKLYLGEENESANADQRLYRFLLSGFGLRLDQDKPDSLQFIGKEVEGEVTWCYLEIVGIDDDFEEMDVTNFLFCDLYETQSNIVHVQSRGQKKSLMLDGFHFRETISFEKN